MLGTRGSSGAPQPVATGTERALAAGATADMHPAHVVSGPVRGETSFVGGPDGERIELLRFDAI